MHRQDERYQHDNDSTYFPRIIFVLRTSDVIRRDDLSEQVGCSIETIKRVVKLLKSFNLIDTTRDGYVKKPKFNKFIRRFMREETEFFGNMDIDVETAEV